VDGANVQRTLYGFEAQIAVDLLYRNVGLRRTRNAAIYAGVDDEGIVFLDDGDVFFTGYSGQLLHIWQSCGLKAVQEV